MFENQEMRITSQKILFLLCLMAYTCAYLSRDTFSAVMPNILKVTDITKTQLGTISTVFLLFYGSGQMVSGILGDKFSPYKLIAIGLFASAICNFLLGFTNNMLEMSILYAINGIALSLLWAPILKVMTISMDEEYRSKSIINISVSMPLGTLIAFILSAFIIRKWDYRISFHLNGVLIFIVFLVWVFVNFKISKYLPSQRITIEQQKDKHKNVKSPEKISTLFLSSGLIFITLAVMFNGMIRNGVSIWVPTYLTETFALEEFLSILVSTILPILNLGGIYVAAYILGKIRNEMITAAFMFIISLVSLALLSFVGHISPLVAILLLGITTSSMQGITAIFLSVVPMHFKRCGKVSTVTGYLNSSAYLASSIGSFIVGMIVTNFGWGMTIMTWIMTAFLGVLVCLIVRKQWSGFVKGQEENQ